MSLYKIKCRSGCLSGCRSEIWAYKPITEKLYKNVARNVARDVARKTTPPIHIKKSSTHTRTAFGDGNSKQESNQGPQSPFQGQRNLLMKEDFFKNPNSSLALAREPRFK